MISSILIWPPLAAAAGRLGRRPAGRRAGFLPQFCHISGSFLAPFLGPFLAPFGGTFGGPVVAVLVRKHKGTPHFRASGGSQKGSILELFWAQFWPPFGARFGGLLGAGSRPAADGRPAASGHLFFISLSQEFLCLISLILLVSYLYKPPNRPDSVGRQPAFIDNLALSQ